MSMTEWEQLQALAGTLNGLADNLDRRPDYDPAAARLIQAMRGIADLARSADALPEPGRLSALLELIEEESKRLSKP